MKEILTSIHPEIIPGFKSGIISDEIDTPTPLFPIGGGIIISGQMRSSHLFFFCLLKERTEVESEQRENQHPIVKDSQNRP